MLHSRYQPRRPGLFSLCALIVAASCAAPDRPPDRNLEPSRAAVNNLADCIGSASVVHIAWDADARLHTITGDGAAAMKSCLIDEHGWQELGPPNHAPGTMKAPA